MTREEIEILEGATEVVDALHDQMRATRAGRPETDQAIEHRLCDLVTQMHGVISQAYEERGNGQ